MSSPYGYNQQGEAGQYYAAPPQQQGGYYPPPQGQQPYYQPQWVQYKRRKGLYVALTYIHVDLNLKLSIFNKSVLKKTTLAVGDGKVLLCRMFYMGDVELG